MSSAAFARWHRHLRKKITSVTFEDGKTIAVGDISELRRYLHCFEEWQRQEDLRKMGIDVPPPAMVRAYRSKEASENASGPRKAVKKEDLEVYRRDFEKKHGRDRGWKKAAGVHFGVSVDTIRKRMDE